MYALNHVSINVYEHDFLVILGGFGSGKSTFLNMLGGIDNVQSGEIFVEGEDIVNFNDKKLTLYRRNTIGFGILFILLVIITTHLISIFAIRKWNIADNTRCRE